MGKNKISILALCLVLWWSSLPGQPVLEQYPVFPKTTEQRIKLIELARSKLYVREATGKNDGKDVVMFLHSVDRKKGDAWCAAFVSWLHIQYSIPNPESGWSPDWFRNNVVYRRPVPRMTPFVSRPGQVFGLYYESKKRGAHVGIIESETRLHYNTIEGNTNAAGSNEGDGVYRKIRRKTDIYAISDFVGWKEYLEGVKKLKK
jgi:hypothetical protein